VSEQDDELNEMGEVIRQALADLSDVYLHDEAGNLLPTTVLYSPEGEVIARWVRGSKPPSEVAELIRTANQIRELPEVGRREMDAGPEL
jgi:hypothetical protein